MKSAILNRVLVVSALMWRWLFSLALLLGLLAASFSEGKLGVDIWESYRQCPCSGNLPVSADDLCRPFPFSDSSAAAERDATRLGDVQPAQQPLLDRLAPGGQLTTIRTATLALASDRTPVAASFAATWSSVALGPRRSLPTSLPTLHLRI